MIKSHKSKSLFEPAIVGPAIVDSLRKLDPRHQIKNPVMFVVLVVSVLTTGLYFQAIFGRGEAPANFILAITLWLWFTLIFANFSEAMAEGRGKAQAASLKKARRETPAKKLSKPKYGSIHETVSATTLRKGDIVLVESGDFIPMDGEIIEGVAGTESAGVDQAHKQVSQPGALEGLVAERVFPVEDLLPTFFWS